MNKLSGNEIRSMFLRFFEEREHRIVRSSSLVPANDPTLLFANAGMNQFKDVFLGIEQRDSRRATTCQKCVRAGGKHNDLENVGFTNRHHTFFEMLGNFSFGDYFKKDAIAFAWELVTSDQFFGIPKDKLYASIFKGEEGVPRDDEAHKYWLEQGIPTERIAELGAAENFWAMGDTGPCGPCSEIFYDMGPAASDAGHANCAFPCDCGRYVEIWNLVFMQFNRDSSGNLNPLPKPSVDTGMGLERTAAVLQGVVSNFDTDLFTPLIERAEQLLNVDHGASRATDASLRIVADHSRATTFLIGDGVLPSNEGRGYVLRKILRRAIQHGRRLGMDRPFMHEMVFAVRDLMKGAYPELVESAKRISGIVEAEEKRFGHTIAVGLKQLQTTLASNKQQYDDAVRITKNPAAYPGHEKDLGNFRSIVAAGTDLDGREAFRLYDTYGLPKDFIEDVTRDAGLQVDWAAFGRAMEEQRTRARASWKGAHKEAASPAYTKLRETFQTEPEFYFGTATRDCRIEAILTKSGQVNEIKAGDEAEVVLDRTTIYAESGGQVADTGAFFDNSEALELAEVRGAYYPVTGLIAHRILAKEDLQVGDRISTVADPVRRARDMRNHTATHLMHAALRNILGTHVKQAGSLVAPDHLRFDFSHFAAVDASELTEIEQQVNEEILKNLEMRTDIMNIDEALASGALAFFGDKYPEANVRVVTLPDSASPRGFYSKELCGGTHVVRTGEIGVFKILSESSTAAGVRRIEAISGDRALAEYQKALATLRDAAALLGANEDGVLEAISRQIEATRSLEKQMKSLQAKNFSSQSGDLMQNVRNIKGIKVLASEVPGAGRDGLRQLVDALRPKLGSGVIVLGSAEDGKVALITAVTKDLTSKLHAGKIVQELAKMVGGSGGGRPDLAEAGGKDTSALNSTIGQVTALIDRLL